MWAAEACDSSPWLSVICKPNCLWEWAPTPVYNIIWPPPCWSSTWPVAVHHTKHQSWRVFCRPFYRSSRKVQVSCALSSPLPSTVFLSSHIWLCWRLLVSSIFSIFVYSTPFQKPGAFWHLLLLSSMFLLHAKDVKTHFLSTVRKRSAVRDES